MKRVRTKTWTKWRRLSSNVLSRMPHKDNVRIKKDILLKS